MVHNDTLHFLADRHNLIDTGTPLITLAPTAVATDRTVELPILCKVFICKTRLLQRRNRRTRHFLFTTRTQSSQQALRHNQADRTGNIKRRDTHIQHTRQRCRCIISMQGRKHHMPCLCRLNRNIGSFQITNLTDHDNVRILTQKRLQGCGKG